VTTIYHRGIVDYITETETRNLTPRMPLHTNRDNAVLRKTFSGKKPHELNPYLSALLFATKMELNLVYFYEFTPGLLTTCPFIPTKLKRIKQTGL
jgi:hypothetical protein